MNPIPYLENMMSVLLQADPGFRPIRLSITREKSTLDNGAHLLDAAAILVRWYMSAYRLERDMVPGGREVWLCDKQRSEVILERMGLKVELIEEKKDEP